MQSQDLRRLVCEIAARKGFDESRLILVVQSERNELWIKTRFWSRNVVNMYYPPSTAMDACSSLSFRML